jgi:hypothetical protein
VAGVFQCCLQRTLHAAVVIHYGYQHGVLGSKAQSVPLSGERVETKCFNIRRSDRQWFFFHGQDLGQQDRSLFQPVGFGSKPGKARGNAGSCQRWASQAL